MRENAHGTTTRAQSLLRGVFLGHILKGAGFGRPCLLLLPSVNDRLDPNELPLLILSSLPVVHRLLEALDTVVTLEIPQPRFQDLWLSQLILSSVWRHEVHLVVRPARDLLRFSELGFQVPLLRTAADNLFSKVALPRVQYYIHR